MGLYDGKKALIFGVANNYSIAWGIAQALHAEGAEVGFSYGIPEPYLPYKIRDIAFKIMPYTFLILFIILWTPNPISFAVGWVASTLTQLTGIDSALVGIGFSLFRIF